MVLKGERRQRKEKKRKKNRAKHALVWHIIKKKRHHKECGTKVQPSIKGDGEYYTENMMIKSALFVTHQYSVIYNPHVKVLRSNPIPLNPISMD